MLDFPDSPAIGDIYTAGGLSWKWDGGKWVPLGSGTPVTFPLAVELGGTGQSINPVSDGGKGLTGTLLLAQGSDPIVPLSDANGTVGTRSAEMLALLGFNGNWPYLELGAARGSLSAPAATRGGDAGALFFTGYGATGWAGSWRAWLSGEASEDWSDTAQGMRLSLHATRAATTATSEVLRLAPEQSILYTDQLQLRVASQNYAWGEAALYLTSPNGIAIGIDGWGNDRIVMRKSAGSPAAPGPVLAYMPLTCLEWQGRLPGGFDSSPAAQFRGYATEDWTGSAHGTGIEILLTRKGSNAIDSMIALTWENTVIASDKVSLNKLAVSGDATVGALYIAGQYLFMAGGSGAVNGVGGPFIFADVNAIVLKVGSGMGQLLFQDYNGVNRATFLSTGQLTLGGGLRVSGNPNNTLVKSNDQVWTMLYAPDVAADMSGPCIGLGTQSSGGGNTIYRANGHYFQDRLGSVGYATFDNNGTSFSRNVTGLGYLQTNVGDGLRCVAPNGSYARSRYEVTGTRVWTEGVFPGGTFGIADENAAAVRLTIGLDGSCANTTGSWVAFSDAVLKQNIRPFERGLDAILALDPVSFQYKPGTPFTSPSEPSETLLGLVAQDVRPHIPEIVGETLAELEGRQVPLATLNTGHLVYVLINAVKELKAQLDRKADR